MLAHSPLSSVRRGLTGLTAGLSLLALGALGAQSALAQSARPAARPAPRLAAARPVYATMVRLGEGGSHILGNPAARVRLAEYVSYTCPHCAHFSAETTAILRNQYIAPGRVSVEVRHVVRDPVDLAMAIATNCGTAARFFSRHEAMMAQHDAIMARVRALPQSATQQWGALPLNQRLRRVADDSGVTAWMRGRGFTAVQIDSCLADTDKMDRLIDQSSQSASIGVQGTPSFTLNGTLVDGVYAWSTLRPALDAALAR